MPPHPLQPVALLRTPFAEKFGVPRQGALTPAAEGRVVFLPEFSAPEFVRGLEAFTASIPPIPTVSILRRPGFEHVANWGAVMRSLGYRTSFLYGGYGYFDNMNAFFGDNGFEVEDRRAIEHVRFENIWGVADEDLFDHALGYYDRLHADGVIGTRPPS